MIVEKYKNEKIDDESKSGKSSRLRLVLQAWGEHEGDNPRGRHLFGFYSTKKDLIDILIPNLSRV